MSLEPFELTAAEAAIAINKGKLNPFDLENHKYVEA